MIKRISQQNVFPDFDLFNEYNKVEKILSIDSVIGIYNNFGQRQMPVFTLEQYIDQLYFNNWNLRGTFTSIAEMRSALGLNKEKITRKSISEDLTLEFLQFALNCAIRVETTIENCRVAFISDRSILTVLIDNIKAMVEKMNCSISFDNKNCEVFISYNNDIADVVSIDNPDTESSITEYRLIDNKGDLKRKGEILCTLFKKLEPIENKFKGTEFQSLASNTTFFFNKVGARHNTDNDKIAKRTFLKMNDKELEVWYDRTYTMFLSCMVVSKYLDFSKEIKDIKSNGEK